MANEQLICGTFINQHTLAMNLYLKYNLEKTCQMILREQLSELGLDFTIASSGNVRFSERISKEQYDLIVEKLDHYGISIIDDRRAQIVQRTKGAIAEMLNSKEMPAIKISNYLADKVGETYRTLSQVFSEVCCISIESFIIIHKIERAKKLLTTEGMSLTEIAFLLNYSSVAHLSHQFKKITGLTPTTFHRLVIKKRNYSLSPN